MFGAATPYVVSVLSLMGCGLIAWTLITTVKHFDPPEARQRSH
jgi:hypothetical protein